MSNIKDRADAVRQYEEKAAEMPAGKEVSEDASVKQPASGRSKGVRILAIIALLIFLGLIIGLIVCMITGSKYTMAMLFCVIIYPSILYIMKWLKKVFSS